MHTRADALTASPDLPMLLATGAWCAFWVGFGVLDWRADKAGRSLCHSVRWLLKTETPAGRVRFYGLYVPGVVVLGRHVVKKAAE